MSNPIRYEKLLTVNGESFKVRQEFIAADEYIDFLSRTDLGKQYPKEDFRNRIETLVKSVAISLVVRDEAGRMAGMCFGITDFAYWLFVTDLAIDRKHERKGLGKVLLEAAHELAGGEKKIIQFAFANKNAIPFYEKLGMRRSTDMMEKINVDWTEFEVGKDDY